jgi:hypothetical protein
MAELSPTVFVVSWESAKEHECSRERGDTMSLFDKSKIPNTGMSPELISYANDGIDKLRARLIDKISVSVLPHYIVKSMVQAFFQGQIRRSLMLIEGGYDAYRSGRGLVVYICARAAYETAVCVLDFCDNLTNHLAGKDFEKTCRFLYSRLYSARMEGFTDNVDGFDNTAINILTQIDRLTKHYFSEDEEELPNQEGHVFKFSNGIDQTPALRILNSAGHMLALMEHGMCVMEDSIARWSPI